MAADVLLDVQHLYMNFGKLTALHDVNFSVEKGEIAGLIGPNGAGKTTLFNVVTGFYRPTSGSVVFKGQDVTRSSPDKLASMGMIRTFQIPRPFKEMSLHDNIAVGTLFNRDRMKATGMSSEEYVSKILRRINLYVHKDDLAGILGYGKLKLLELGRSQGPIPDLLLLDEPFAGLNSGEIDAVSAVIREMSKAGMTLIIVEHKLRELMKLVERIIVIHYGKKIADGSPEEVSQDAQVLTAYLGRRWSSKNA